MTDVVDTSPDAQAQFLEMLAQQVAQILANGGGDGSTGGPVAAPDPQVDGEYGSDFQLVGTGAIRVHIGVRGAGGDVGIERVTLRPPFFGELRELSELAETGTAVLAEAATQFRLDNADIELETAQLARRQGEVVNLIRSNPPPTAERLDELGKERRQIIIRMAELEAQANKLTRDHLDAARDHRVNLIMSAIRMLRAPLSHLPDEFEVGGWAGTQDTVQAWFAHWRHVPLARGAQQPGAPNP